MERWKDEGIKTQRNSVEGWRDREMVGGLIPEQEGGSPESSGTSGWSRGTKYSGACSPALVLQVHLPDPNRETLTGITELPN